MIFTFLIVYWVGYNGFSQPEIFNFKVSSNPKQNDYLKALNPTLDKKNNITFIDERKSFDLFQQFTFTIKQEKLFLHKNLTIKSLSVLLNTNEKKLSRLIKIHTRNNFYHYINQFRVNEYKQLLKTKKGKQLTLLGLSEECGFNSKSTFYSVFKSFEGMTPKQYKALLNKSE